MNKPKIGEMCWSELATTDVNAAREFYGELLGWTYTDISMGDSTYILVKANDRDFAGMYHIPAQQQEHISPHWIGYILVEDLEKTMEKAKKMGATIKMPVTEAGNMGRFIVIADPTGAHIAFWQANESCS